MPAKLLVLGFELGDGRLFRSWAQAGHLPEIAGLLARGIWRELQTPAERLHVSAWPSLYTGVGPGGHGVYFTFQPASGVQGWQRFAPGIYARPTVWRLLAAADRRVLVFDAPYSHPEAGFAGDAIFDWGSWARYLETTAVPKTLLRRLKSNLGAYPLPWEAHALGLKPLPPAEVEPALVRAVAVKATAISKLMAERDYDLVFAVFGETHVAAHYLFDPASGQVRLRTVYEALDRAVGTLVRAAGANASLVLVSGDAVRPNHAGWHLLPEVLFRLGHFASAEFAKPQAEAAPPAATPKAGLDPVRWLRDLLPKDVRKQLAGLLPRGLRDRLARRVDTATIDWSKTRAFPLPTDLEGCIRINLQGREPLGIVAPGAEYEALLDQLEVQLAALRLADGTPAVREVIRSDRVFAGPGRDRLPDLIVTWSEAMPIDRLLSPAIGEVAGASPDPRPGTHGGPGFALTVPYAGTVSQTGVGDVCDLAPTLLAAFGLTPPAYMEGRPWPELSALNLRSRDS
jgi:predicted AlkP superfamily phosphohydrolase/phosphomutase